ncbi:MAG TPA: carbohydrate ABC transporter permease [Spirochaetes bacterium]|nr:carbohydrate ABC transporter permease [Spirochaetota bacterium]
MKVKTHYSSIFKYLALILATAVSLYPIFWLITVSLKTQAQYLQSTLDLPWPLDFGNFTAALHGGRFYLWFMNSGIITIGSVILATAASLVAAFAIVFMDFKGKQILLNSIISLMAVPIVVMIVPLYILFARIHLMSTYPGVILIYAAICIPFSIYLLTSFFRTLPGEIVEAAIMDGCSTFKVLSKILVPLSIPPVLTLIIVNALYVWNDLLIALVFLPKNDMRTLMVGVTIFKSRFNLDVPLTMAGLLMISVPMIIVYIVFQRFFIRGLTSGALKG